MFLGPFDASAHHQGREALLVYINSVLDQSEIDKGDLEDMAMEVAFEENLTTSF